MLRFASVVLALVTAAACGGKTKQPASTPAPAEAAPADDGAAGTDTGSAPTPDAEGATQDDTMKGDPCDGGE